MENKDHLEVEPKDRINRPRGKMILDNFLGGVAWSLGTLVGATIIIGIIGLLLSKIDLVPIIGTWINQIIEVTNQYRVK